jgi:D-glycero-D-manno-heptose 1,7-bisphosphate phosphatase
MLPEIDRSLAPVAIFDRDGTINYERHYISDPDQVELLPGSAAGMRLLQLAGYRLVIVTNQSGLARGYFNSQRLAAIHRRLLDLLSREGISIDGVYHCPHHPSDDCACRKPRSGMVERAARELDFDPSGAILFGDKPCDIELGRAVGAFTVLVSTGYGANFQSQAYEADMYAADIEQAAVALVGGHGSSTLERGAPPHVNLP